MQEPQKPNLIEYSIFKDEADFFEGVDFGSYDQVSNALKEAHILDRTRVSIMVMMHKDGMIRDWVAMNDLLEKISTAPKDVYKVDFNDKNYGEVRQSAYINVPSLGSGHHEKITATIGVMHHQGNGKYGGDIAPFSDVSASKISANLLEGAENPLIRDDFGRPVKIIDQIIDLDNYFFANFLIG